MSGDGCQVTIVHLTVIMPNGGGAEADSKHSCMASNSKHAQGPDHQRNLKLAVVPRACSCRTV